MTRRPLATVALAVLLGVAGCSTDEAAPSPATPSVTIAAPSQAAKPEAITVRGLVGLSWDNALDLTSTGAGVCDALGPAYSPIEEGVQVRITDASGAIVGTGSLEAPAILGAEQDKSQGCVWWFAVEVPAGGEFYTATVLEWSSQVLDENDVDTKTAQISPEGTV